MHRQITDEFTSSSKELNSYPGNRKSSISSNEYSSNSNHLTDSSKQLQRRLRKKISANGDCTNQTDVNSSIQLVSYKKVDNEVDFLSKLSHGIIMNLNLNIKIMTYISFSLNIISKSKKLFFGPISTLKFGFGFRI